MAYMYKQYVRLLAKWPRDSFKSRERNLLYFMENEIEKLFKHNSPLPDAALCDKRFKALQELCDNRHLTDFPHKYTSGVFGLKLPQLQETNSDEFRESLGLGKPKKSFLRSLFGKKEKDTNI